MGRKVRISGETNARGPVKARPRSGYYGPQGKVHTPERSHGAQAHTDKAAAHDALREGIRKSFKEKLPHHAARKFKV